MKFIKEKGVLPIVVVKDPFEIDDKLFALYKGGIKIAEIEYRSSKNKEILKYAIEKMGSKIYIGAGTILNATQAEEAISVGAKFITSPGFSKDILRVCDQHKIKYIPSVETAAEIAKCLNYGIKYLKFFPAEQSGGLEKIRAFHKMFPEVLFMPSGGINESNLQHYLCEDYIPYVCGSFMFKGTISDITIHTKNTLSLINALKK
ncbi:MAG: bifunctional 4-hydroxy-2-oxoglutarate aldolase/2-dehydro-3-deoxy-phosphogluconate aldolase [Gammaproteobacteria bacterium]|nr:bifunctional 4-hydroxy-2-oxoglutarate aldolase/2-dehydro-3-deoxy-phosphogluconate aldolase [Gammaproteobacteria bacterium]